MTGHTIDLAEARMLRRAREGVPAAVAAVEAKTGERYRMTAGGLLRHRPGAFPEMVCERIDVLGEGYDAAARSWGLLVQFLDRDGEAVRLVLPHRLFRSARFDLVRLLARRGFTVRPGRAAARVLRDYLAAFRALEAGTPGRAC